ncbi:MAG: DUF4129 domain-containing protein [Planctomycetes bacterium]|nr:DUF4129 domain-containing protein [Planctomycetota bacterium]
MNSARREALYGTLARLSGLGLIVLCVLFQRRGLLAWSELVFLGLCIALQETFLRLPVLRKLRAPMLVGYSMLPLALVLFHAREIHAFRGDFVQIVLYTPLPLVLVSVQIMVLYVKESARLVSVVLVLALFSTVIGVRRPVDDSVWPWLAMIGAAGATFLMLQHPGMLFQGVYVTRRPGTTPPAGSPGGVVRGAFFSVLPLFTCSVLIASLLLYIGAPRFEPQGKGQGGIEIANNPPTDGGPDGPIDTRRRGNPRNPRDPRNTGPASVSGLAEGIDLGDFGEIKRSGTPALTVSLVAPENDFVQQVYMRAFTYATFDGYSWLPLQSNPRDVAALSSGADRPLRGAPAATRGGRRDRRYRVTVLEAGIGGGGQLPMPVEPYALHGYRGEAYYDSVTQTLRAPQAGEGTVYDVTAGQLLLSDNQMKDELNGTLPDLPTHMDYLQVPSELRAGIKQRFNQTRVTGDGLYDRFELMANTAGAYTTASGIVHMFRTAETEDGKAWVYSLDFRPEPGADAIARFLDTNNPRDRMGHCEYFATAMCMLLRCFGIPSRVAAGFLATKPDENGQFNVKASAAHAWVEVWIDGFAWVTFDPTPGDDDSGGETDEPVVEQPAPDNPETGSEATTPDAASAAAVDQRDWVERYDATRQQELFREMGSSLRAGLRNVDEFLLGLTSWLPGWLPRSGILRSTALVLPPAVFLLLFLLGRRRRKRIEAKVLQQMGEGGKKRQRGLYLQLLLLLAKYGYQKRPSETPREFADRVTRRGGDQHLPVVELTELYYALRFGLNESLESDFRRALVTYADALKAAPSDASNPPRPA